ncbi:hypothetical protein [Phytopseudomonas dryadis]|uniref:Lipoprotein n=1 Tax=Phytopseudomonas dryadis TaxID=2487520 RepID=A0ABY1Z7J6_9GAMM|nr:MULTISPECIES: hypothetical protein [Pseudomonas]TBV05481.1 hypothetical protein DNK34_13150 [Pseudomonas dryadis]TBV18490.1 hypothetical protein DNK41_08940 [Pseudomonas sp. FRB 230]
MHKSFMLAACLLLGACANTSPSSLEPSVRAEPDPIGRSNLEAIHDVQAIPLPLKPGVALPKARFGAHRPAMDFGSSLSNYRVYSLALKKGERYRLNVNSLCDDTCMGIDTFALKPRALLLDTYGTVIPDKPLRASSVVGMLSMGWDGEAPEDGTYYLLVAADNEDVGHTIVIDDVWINNSPLMAVKVDRRDGVSTPSVLR